jgi:predicted porin
MVASMTPGFSSRAVVAAAISVGLGCKSVAAEELTRAEIQEMRAEIKMLRQKVDLLTAKVNQASQSPSPRRKQPQALTQVPANTHIPAAAQPPSPATQETTVLKSQANAGPSIYASQPPAGHGFMEYKPGKTLTFYVPSGEITAYGFFDVSVDGATKGMGALRGPGNTRPVGNMGWQPDISTNLSYVGIRGFEKIPGQDFRFVYQLETQIDISAQSGTAETNSNQSNVVKGGLTSRNTYLGLSQPDWGAILIGKTDAPYKVSTQRMNPFLGMLGDYGVIMGNTGGDNRVEFGTRLDHSIWYESPEIAGLKLNALYSPGQNRAKDSDNIAAGESDCTGGNVPGSGGSLPIACNDGAFSDAVSVSLSYTNGPLYAVAAYERHSRVNRSSDLTGEYANPPTAYFNADTADEDAAKVGVQYAFPTQTTVSGIFETLHRYVPSFLEFQNERQRIGTWFAATQRLSPNDDFSIGWAHAGRTPGDPGQHNTSLELPPLGQPGDGTGGAHVNNSSNLFSAALLHNLGSGLSAYIDWALVSNSAYAHYALGAGGRSITYDCHDASDASGGLASNPHCWAGNHPQGISVGMRYRF